MSAKESSADVEARASTNPSRPRADNHDSIIFVCNGMVRLALEAFVHPSKL
jgi:hypothetical protein